MYRNLDAARILDTIGRLRERITARFPEASLAKVAGELEAAGRAAAARAEWLARPNILVRFGVGFLLVLIAAILGLALANLRVDFRLDRFSELVQAVESTLNDLVYVGVAIFFLVRIEVRLKRSRVLPAIHELRSLAHIIDMHQLTKDPQVFLMPVPATTASPERTLGDEELARYLDYCSEMLSLVGKVAALYAQRFDDPVVLSAVDQVEDLTTGLSRKVWQKISLLQPTARA